MTISKLVSGVLLTNNCSRPRNHKIDRITPHYMAGYATAKACCESFVPASRKASANYCIGKDGEIWCNVEEENRAWTSGNSINDNRAITIECANYMDNENYGRLPDATWNSLVLLCVDICKRYNFRLNYTGTTSGNLTKHKWFQDTDCPGPWLNTQFSRLANEVNKRLVLVEPINPPMVFGGTYRCTVDCLRVRDAPTTKGNVITYYDAGDIVVLDDWFTSSDGYIWGRYTGSTSGVYRYVAVGLDTGKVEPDDYLVKL